jgi:hypothetical protein
VLTPALAAPPDIAVDEGDGYVDLPVTLSAPGINPVSLTAGTSPGTAGFGTSCPADYVTTSSSVTFAPGETTKVVRVQILDCPEVEGVVTFKLHLSAQVNATIARADTVISLVDNATAWTPNNTTLPTISGLARNGQMLTATQGSWSGAPATYQYSWQRCDSNGGVCGTIGGATTTSYVLGNADLGHKVRVQVTATNGLGTSQPAYSIATDVVLGVPGAPVNVVAIPGDGQVMVTFSPPPSDGGGGLTYTVTASPGGAFATGSSSPITIVGLTNGSRYTFTVTATNAAGTGPPSAPSNIAIPAKARPAVPDPPPPAPRPPVPDPPTGLPRPPQATH